MSDSLVNQLMARAAQANLQPGQAGPPRPEQDSMVLPHAIYLGGAAADIGSTAYAQRRPELGLSESNPIISRLPVGAQLPVGSAMEGLGYMLARKLLKDKHPKLFKAGLIGAGIAHGLAGANNIRLIKKSGQ